MLQINGKTFMNLQEAVQWLLDNNALPFQSSANYIANTEIGLGTIVNPSPAKVRIGSLIFFADSKVSTVTGLTENGFIVSDQYNDLVDDVVYVSNVQLNASGHLIVTLSNGDNIDAGLIKQVSGFSIDASQHLIVSYNDGTSTDLGAIFNGNVNISGDLNVSGSINGIISGHDINTDGNIVADIIKQASPNFSDGITPSIGSGLEIEDIYNRVEEINGVLYLVFNYAVANNTGASVTAYTAGVVYVNLPSEIAEKVIDLNGHSVHIADASACTISTFEGYYLNATNEGFAGKIDCELENANAQNQMIIKLSINGGLTWANGDKKYFTCRTFLTLL